jgi:hypothetical protein
MLRGFDSHGIFAREVDPRVKPAGEAEVLLLLDLR